MTACRNKARGAVTAALVGVLSVGAVPMVVMAAGVNDGASMMALDENNVNGGTVNYKDGQSGDSFAFTGEGQGLVPESITPVAGDAIELSILPKGYASETEAVNFYAYVCIDGTSTVDFTSYNVEYKDADGKSQVLKGSWVKDTAGNFTMPSNPGKYAVVSGVYENGSFAYVKTAGYFTITGKSLAGATLYEIKADANDLSDTTFSYTGEYGCRDVANVKASMGVALNGTVLKNAVVEIYAVGTSTPLTTGQLTCGADYVAVVTDAGDNYDGNVQIPFTYGKLDLSTADIETVTVTGAAPSATSTLADIVSTINGFDVDASNSNFNSATPIAVTFKSDPDGNPTTVNNKKGVYTFELSVPEASKDYITGTKEVKVLYADQVANVKYDNGAFTDVTVDLTDDEPKYFDISKIAVEYTVGGDTKKLDADQFEVTVLNEDGEEVSADSLKQAGTWTVKVDVQTTVDGLLIACSDSVKVTNSYQGITQNANVYMTYDGENVQETCTPTYTGEDLSGNIAVKVVAGSKTLVEGTDYKVTITNAEGDEVDEIVDAGKYTVTVKGITYTATDAKFVIDVQKVVLDSLKPAKPFAVDTDNKVFFLNYTGEELEPEYVFTDKDGNEWTLDADEYEVSYLKNGTTSAKLQDEGKYIVDGVTFNSKNFSGSTLLWLEGGYSIEVTANRVFADVDNDAYYAEAIATAKQQGYIFGVNNTNFFMPERSISRADMVCVLYRMASGKLQSEDWVAGPNDLTYLSQYSDVNGDEYYAQALVWATKAGVVSGYEDGRFGGADMVTTEQFVTMLGRYAELVGNFEAVEDVDATLAEKADGSQVSGFAAEYVAWALENGFIGRDGADIQPRNEVSRGRSITIAVRYQPEQAELVVE